MHQTYPSEKSIITKLQPPSPPSGISGLSFPSRGGSDIESLEGALDCYFALDRLQDALRICVELVNAKADAGDLEGALAVIDRMSSAAPDANFGERRSELLVALGRPESVGR